MSSNGRKHVQTELADDEYEQFREFASERGLSLKEAGREAVVEWVERHRQADPSDAAFVVLDRLDDESSQPGAETDVRREGDLADEWHGRDVEFTLAADPPGED